MAIKAIFELSYCLMLVFLGAYQFIFGDYENCVVPLPFIKGIIPLIGAFSTFGTFLWKNDWIAKVGRLMNKSGMICLFFALLMSQLLLFLNLSGSPGCVEIKDFSNLMTILTVLNFINLVIATVFFYFILCKFMVYIRGYDVSNKVEDIYRNIYSMSRPEINEFIMNNQAFINKKTLGEKEVTILYDKYSK